MADNPENVFEAEAQEEALLSRTESLQQGRLRSSGLETGASAVGHSDDQPSETSHLLPNEDSVRRRQGYSRAGDSYQRAIDEPWTGSHGAHDLPWYKRPSIYWLLPAFFPFCIAFGGMIVPRTYLVLNLICRGYLLDKAARNPNFHFLPVMFDGGENPQCRDWRVQQENAWFNTYSELLTGIFSAIATPHLGALSDRIGRKKVLVCASVGGLVSEIITIIVGTHPETASVYWLLLGSLADGICGSFSAGMALTFAYASDCTAPEKRLVSFGYLQGTLFAGIALGPIFAGWLIKKAGNVVVVFYVVVACHIFFVSFITLLVPESLSKARQIIAREKHDKELAANASRGYWETFRFTNIFEPLWVLWPTGAGSSPALRRNLVFLAAIDTMMFGVAMGTMRIILIYAEYRFGWNAVDSSVFMSVVNITRVSFLLLLLPLLRWLFRNATSHSGHKGSDKLDIGIIRTSIVFDLLGYLGYALTPSGLLMILSGVVASVGGMGSPTLQSSITKHLPADRTGQVLGALGLLHALARVVAPTVFNLIYGLTVKFYAGIVFLCLGSVFIIVFIISWFLKPNLYLEESTPTTGSSPPEETE